MVALLKANQLGYTIKRGENEYWVDNETKRIIRKVSGGQGTAPTPASQASAAQATLNQFLQIAPRKYYSILGTVAAGSTGGSTSNVVWQQPIPIIPAFCTAIDYDITLPVTVVGNGAATATLSPFAPYSAVACQFLLGGAPPWPLTELTPWYLDGYQHEINNDPGYFGLGGGSVSPFQPAAGSPPAVGAGAILDMGLLPEKITGAGSLAPGTTVTPPASPGTTYTWQFYLRIMLQRKRHLLWGAVPFGDPENRPNNITQIYPLVGNLPEQSLFVNVGSGVTATVASPGATVNAVYELAYVDLQYPGMDKVPTPAVAFGLQLTPSTTTGMNAGSIFPITHRTAQLYTQIHHLLINGELPIQTDYFGLWDDQDQQSARWSFDSQANTLNEYWKKYKNVYRRYPLLGHYVADFEAGVFPIIPSITPYDALMTPDASYAAAFGIPVTPAMTTALRIKSGTALSSPYVRNYEVGLVRVPY